MLSFLCNIDHRHDDHDDHHYKILFLIDSVDHLHQDDHNRDDKILLLIDSVGLVENNLHLLLIPVDAVEHLPM